MNKLMLFLIFSVISCSMIYAQNDKTLEINIDHVSKKWEVIDVINPNKTPEDLAEIKSMLEGVILEIRNDSTFLFSFVLDLEGTWYLDENVIFTKDRKGDNKWVIHSLEENKLVASRNDSKQKLVFKSL